MILGRILAICVRILERILARIHSLFKFFFFFLHFIFLILRLFSLFCFTFLNDVLFKEYLFNGGPLYLILLFPLALKSSRTTVPLLVASLTLPLIDALCFSLSLATDVQRDAVRVEICSQVFCFEATTNSPPNMFQMLANVHLRPRVARPSTREHIQEYVIHNQSNKGPE